MKKLFTAALICFCTLLFAQPKMELTASGFSSMEFPMPDVPLENLIETAKGWASNYNRNGYDVYDEKPNMLKIDAVKENGFYYMNRGQKFVFKIKYTLAIVFEAKVYKLSFAVKEIYGKDDTAVKSGISGYFTNEGQLKEGFDDVKPSLEYTAERIVGSFVEAINKQ
ncbi:MAG: hypothetical protein CFE23_08805 [Flavobacterium sp. BFFFF1]|uniref:hypothetical protein n=1 Tax=Flavobacterium sp. BFFFF1 TaxID=2015557 RepID=UPI000BDBC420|nr:hypothetical protein [Flavobacterium sp. BFFFF1]OYU80570.1 MAG: hypothetical protein CFE23_08805 [Flavobacterium sp. BFFFF1]